MADEDTLTEADRLAAGHAILTMTDEAGLDAQSAGWLLTEGMWRFFLTSPLVDDEGPAWVYRRLLRLFGARPLPAGCSATDVMVISPMVERALVGDIDVAFDTQEAQTGVGMMFTSDLPATNGHSAARAVFLRRRPHGGRPGTAKQFDRGVSRLAA